MATTTLPGAIAGYLFLAQLRSAVPYVMALSVASFLYIAMADLVPHPHRRGRDLGFASQLALMLAGIATIILIRAIAA